MASDPFAAFTARAETPPREQPSLRAQVEKLAEQVAALQNIVERTLLPAIAGQGAQPLAGQLAPGPGQLFPAGTSTLLPAIPGQQFLQPGPVTQHDARRTLLHHLNGTQVTIGGIEQHLELDPVTNSRKSEQTVHRYLGLDGRTIHDQGDLYACTSCEWYPLTNPRFCSACQEPTCSNCLIGYQNNFFCPRHDPRPSFWESLFG
jgi:hypothetical protein